jgi:hypothetical protein
MPKKSNTWMLFASTGLVALIVLFYSVVFYAQHRITVLELAECQQQLESVTTE